MFIGHINLARSMHGAGDHFVSLVEALQRHEVTQYVLVKNVALAKRLDAVAGVTVGPVVSSAIMAYCLMPRVDLVHIHDASGEQSGLLLALTRSIPFVLTQRKAPPGRKPLKEAVYRRASGIVYQHDDDAAKHLRIYRHAIELWRATTAAS